MKILLFAISFCSLTFNVKGAEVFIRVLKTGTHYSTVYNQTQYNSTNIFRFFDLPGGTIPIQVIGQNTGTFLYNSSMYLNSNQRIVAELDIYGNFNVLQNIIVEYSNWYSPIQNGLGVNNGSVVDTNGNPNTTVNNQYNQQMFTQFLNSLDKESFDSKKLDKAKKYIDKGNLNASQIADIAKKFSFDSNRLDWAKYAYTKCNDKANYFILKEVFSFSSSYDELEEYMLTH